MLRKKTKEEWTERHRHVAKKLVLEGGWVQKRLFDIGWSDESKCQACHKGRKARKSSSSTTAQNCTKSDGGFQMLSENGSKKREPQRRSGNGQRGIVTHPLNESQWNKGLFSMKKEEHEKHKSWGIPAEGFKGHAATDGSLLGRAGNWDHVVGQ